MTHQIIRATPIKPLYGRKKKEEVPKKESNWRKAKEVAEYLGVSLPTISRWTNREHDPLPSRRLSGVLQYDFEKVKKWEERNSSKNY